MKGMQAGELENRKMVAVAGNRPKYSSYPRYPDSICDILAFVINVEFSRVMLHHLEDTLAIYTGRWMDVSLLFRICGETISYV